MSGQYGQYGNYSQPPYHYGPPQPEWQPSHPPPSRSSWQDPRLSEQHQSAGQGAASSNYNPNTYGPVSGAAAPVQPAYPPNPHSQNTSTWGVRYNHSYQDSNSSGPKPPLPPRPPSTQHIQSPVTYGTPQHQWHGQNLQAEWTSGHEPSVQASFSTWPQNVQQASQPSSSGTPPPPPPRPPAYQNLSQSAQAWPEHQYSEMPPSHRYEPALVHDVSSGLPSATGNTHSQNLDWQGQSYASHEGNTVQHLSQTEQPAVSPISPEKEDIRPFGWEQPGTQPTIASPMLEQQQISSGFASAPVIEKPSQTFTPPTNNISNFSRSSTGNTGHTYIPKRDDSVSPELKKTDTIDDLISSWQKPLSAVQEGNLDPRTSRRSSVSALDEGPSLPVSAQFERLPSTIKQETKSSGAILDPLLSDIEELKPESRASLERYLTALRREGTAATDEDKYRVFKAFMNKELRLKAILYGVEEDEPTLFPAKSIAGLTQPLEEKALNSSKPLPQSFAPEPGSSGKTSEAVNSPPPHKDETSHQLVNNATTTRRDTHSPPMSNDESYVLVDGSAEGEYSPGGRPRIAKFQPEVGTTLPLRVPTIEIPTREKAPPQRVGSPSDYAPIVVEAPDKKGANSPGVNAPIVLDRSDLPQANIRVVSELNEIGLPVSQSPPRPVYTPFRYNEGPSNSSYAELRQASTESGRVMSQVNSASPTHSEKNKSGNLSIAPQQQEETFVGLIREKSKRYSFDQGKSPRTDPVEKSNSLAAISACFKNTKSQDFGASTAVTLIHKELEQFHDDFGFIRQNVLAWDRSNKDRISKLTAGRRQREEDSEAHIDELFNAKQIGYPDIKTLESEFRQSEALKQQEEFREELQSFITQIYDKVTSRIDPEIRGLKALYARSLQLLEKDAVSSSQLATGTEETNNRPKVAAVLEVTLQIFNKMQMRYRKRVEAERERQRRSALCDASSNRVSNQFDAANKNEADYALFERQAAVQAAKEHDERANKLMDIIDIVVVKALSENEHFIDNLKTKLEQADVETKDPGKFKGDLYGANGLRPLLSSAEAIITAVSADSASILQGSDVADQLLNNADYDLSVTKARMEHADENTFRQLEEDKMREDEKIRAETASRATGMNKGPEEALHLVRSIIARIGDDPEHQQRIKKALEAAKKRNAAKET